MIGSKIKIGIIVALLAGIGALFWINQAAIRDAARKAQALWQSEQTVSDLESLVRQIEKERARVLEIVDRHADAIQKARKEARVMRDKWEAMQNDKEIKDWAARPVPDAVGDFVRVRAKDGDKD